MLFPVMLNIQFNIMGNYMSVHVVVAALPELYFKKVRVISQKTLSHRKDRASSEALIVPTIGCCETSEQLRFS